MGALWPDRLWNVARGFFFVAATTTARGFFAQMDLGVAKPYFELEATGHPFTWA